MVLMYDASVTFAGALQVIITKLLYMYQCLVHKNEGIRVNINILLIKLIKAEDQRLFVNLCVLHLLHCRFNMQIEMFGISENQVI